jgi:hypothetical protein
MFRFFGKRSKAPARKASRNVRPQLEELEDRVVPAGGSTVPTTSGGLPYATATSTAQLIDDINYANSNTGNFTINLTDNTYNFTSANNNTFGPNALPVITGNITINGNGAVLERDPSLGNNTPFRFFYVSGSQVASPSGSQSTVAATGSLTLENLTLEGGLVQGGSSGTGGGGLGAGGAIFNMGNLTLNGVTVEQNDAVGGSSGTGSGGTSGGGLGSGATTSGNFGVGGAAASTGAGGAGGFGGGGGAGTKNGAGGFGAGSGNGTIGGGGAGMGGGIFSMYGTTTLINSTLANNLAQGGQGASSSGDGDGGALFNLDGTLNVITSTLADNSTLGAAGSGGGAVYNLALGNASSGSAAPSTVNLTDSILADSQGSDDLVNNENSSPAGSAVVNATTPNIVTSTNTINGATTNGTPITSNPDLGPLTSSGGLTPTMPLQSNSPALGTGASASNVPATDQRGVARGSVIDLGAYQGTPSTAVPTTLSLSSSTPTASSGASVTLTATVTQTSNSIEPAGTVTFVDNTTGKTLGSAALSSGQATLTTTSVSSGDSITATYSSSNGMGNSTGAATVPAAGAGAATMAAFDGLLIWPSASSSSSSSTLPIPTSSAETAYEAYLNQLYETLLGRPIDATGLSEWSSDLQGGMTPSQVVYDIEQTTEYQTDEVNAAFETLLGTAAPTSAVNYLVGLMHAGADFRIVEAIIVGTPEFYQAAGGTNQDFLNKLYADFLGRTVDATSGTAWENFLAAGGNATEVALGVLYSPEYLTDLVNEDYQTYFGAAAASTSSASVSAYASALQGGTLNNAQVVATMLGSPEYGTQYGLASTSVSYVSQSNGSSSTSSSGGSTNATSSSSSTNSSSSSTSSSSSSTGGLTYTTAKGLKGAIPGGTTSATAAGGKTYTTPSGAKYTIGNGDLTLTAATGAADTLTGGSTSTTASGGLAYKTTAGSTYTIGGGSTYSTVMGTTPV